MLRDFALKDGHILVKQTGAVIPVNTDFFKEFARGASFAAEVSAIRAARKAKAQFSPVRSTRTKIAFTPIMPYPWYAIWPVCQLAGLDITRNIHDADILFYFEDHEFSEDRLFANEPRPVLNGKCCDIRKSRVAEVFEAVFGYSLRVDPQTYTGPALQKSEKNGVHDGQIVTCPNVTPLEGYVYQRLVDNTLDGDVYTDIRTPIVGGTIPTVYLKHRKASDRFSNDNFKVGLTTAEEQFSHKEQEQIIAFARAMNLDFGGMDVLRDRENGRIYIVDVNKTDMGPPTALPHQNKHEAMNALAAAFGHFVSSTLKQA